MSKAFNGKKRSAVASKRLAKPHYKPDALPIERWIERGGRKVGTRGPVNGKVIGMAGLKELPIGAWSDRDNPPWIGPSDWEQCSQTLTTEVKEYGDPDQDLLKSANRYAAALIMEDIEGCEMDPKHPFTITLRCLAESLVDLY